MTNGLAQALNGNFASLTKVGFVLDENTKKQIKSGTETERAEALVKVLNSTYKDFNKNLRATNAGKMQVLANSADAAKTIIGVGLIDALTGLGKDDSVDNLAKSMEDVATYTADVIRGIGILSEKLINLPPFGIKLDVGLIPIVGAYIKIAQQIGKQDRLSKLGPQTAGRFFAGGSGGNIADNTRARELKKAEADRLARAKALAALQTKSLATDKAKLALSKAGSVLDTTRISIAAALKGKISETDRLSLNLQLALLNENEGQATKLAKQLEAAIKRQNELSAALLATPEAPNPYAKWKMPVMTMPSVPLPEGLVKDTLVSLGVSSIGDIPSLNTGGLSDAELDLIDAVTDFMKLFPDGIAGTTPEINVVVVLDGDPIAGAVSEVQTNNNLSGSFTTVGGRGANTARFT